MSHSEWPYAVFWCVIMICITAIVIATIISFADAAEPVTGYATYYDRASCAREGTSGIRADGKPLDDDALTCAAWGYPFGTKLRVTHGDQSVVVSVQDRGPGRKARARGVVVDLTRAAFLKLAPLERGRIQVRVEVLDAQ